MADETMTTESENQAPETSGDDTTSYDYGAEDTQESQDTTEEIGQEKEVKTDKADLTEEKETKPINQEAVDKKISKVVFEKHEERRKREEAEKKLEDAQKELEKFKGPGEGLLQVPPIPDYTDYDYNKKIQERDAIIDKNAEIKARKAFEAQKIIDKQNQIQQQEQNLLNDNIKSMYTKATDYGYTQEDFRQSDQQVAMILHDPAVARFILKQENSPLIVKYLAQNIPELEKVSSMSTIEAVAHIAGNISPLANKLKPGTTKTPDPLDIPKGKAATEKTSKFLDGVVYE